MTAMTAAEFAGLTLITSSCALRILASALGSENSATRRLEVAKALDDIANNLTFAHDKLVATPSTTEVIMTNVHPSWSGHIVEPGTWYIARWPDGTECDWDERHQYTYMSDDYECREVCTTDDEGNPQDTTSCSPPRS